MSYFSRAAGREVCGHPVRGGKGPCWAVPRHSGSHKSPRFFKVKRVRQFNERRFRISHGICRSCENLAVEGARMCELHIGANMNDQRRRRETPRGRIVDIQSSLTERIERKTRLIAELEEQLIATQD